MYTYNKGDICMDDSEKEKAMQGIVITIINGIQTGKYEEKNSEYPNQYEEYIQSAVEKKRQGDYLGSLMEYYYLIDIGKTVYPSIVYYMFKVALCAEKFELAMEFLEESILITGYHPDSNQQSMQLNWYSDALHRAADNGDYSALEKYASAFSGREDYKFKSSKDTLKGEARKALDFFKETQPALYAMCPNNRFVNDNPYF